MARLKIYTNSLQVKLNFEIILVILVTMINYSASANHTTDPKYGNAQSSEFINAMYGSSEGFTPEEIKTFNHGNYHSSSNKYFLRIGASTGHNSLSNLQKVIIPPAIADAILATTKEKIPKQRNLEIALGYQANKFATEIELVVNKNLKYSQPKLFSNKDGSLSSIIKSQVLLLNGYYDICSFKRFDLFMGLGIGLGLNLTNSKFALIPSVDDSIDHYKSNWVGSYNVLIGGKFKIISQFFLKASLRYTHLSGFGKLKSISTGDLVWKDIHDNLILKGKRSFFGYSLSIVHIFI